MKPLCIDLFCGLGGWTDGFLAESYDVIGCDIERHDYGSGGYPGQLVIQDVRTLEGRQLKDAAVIVASPPCQAYSWMAMPWSLAKKKAEEIRNDYFKYSALNELFVECFRIQWEACEAAGRHIPLIVENVKGAQPWVGRAKANYGSFFLWGDIAQVGNRIVRTDVQFGYQEYLTAPSRNFSGLKLPGNNEKTQAQQFRENQAGIDTADATKFHISGHAWYRQSHGAVSSNSTARKAASAQIAKIPLPLSRHIARVFKP